MKKLLLALIFIALIGAEATAYRGYGFRRNRHCGSACAVAEPCAPVCESVCERPCKTACAQTYEVIDDYACEVPKCVKFVEVEEPAICRRTCNWECPPGTNFAGATVQEAVQVRNQRGELSTMHNKGNY